MIYILIIVLVVGLSIFGATGIVEGSKHLFDKRRKALLDSRRTLNKAEVTLRRIAAGSSDAALDAQICLNEIDTYHERELN